MKNVTFTIPYDDLTTVLDVLENHIKKDKIKNKNSKSWSKEEEVYFHLMDLWGSNASKEINSEFDAYTVQEDYNVSNKDFNALIICSFRYALGRSSYMPSLISSIISLNKHCLTNNTINIIIEEIETAPCYGDENKKEIWMDLKKELEEFLVNRNKENL